MPRLGVLGIESMTSPLLPRPETEGEERLALYPGGVLFSKSMRMGGPRDLEALSGDELYSQVAKSTIEVPMANWDIV